MFKTIDMISMTNFFLKRIFRKILVNAAIILKSECSTRITITNYVYSHIDNLEYSLEATKFQK
jgi:hypothetical protein